MPANTYPSGSPPPTGPMMSTSPAIATTDPTSTTGRGSRRVATATPATSSSGARYSISSADDTGMRCRAAKYTSWVPATPISAMPRMRQRARHTLGQRR